MAAKSTPGPTSTRSRRCCYEMLAGEPPFTGQTVHAIVAKRIADPTPSVTTLESGCPSRGGRGDPEGDGPGAGDRFVTVAEFAQVLHAPPERATASSSRPCHSPDRSGQAPAPVAESSWRCSLGNSDRRRGPVRLAANRPAARERHQGHRRAPLRESGRLGRCLLRRRCRRRGPDQAGPGPGLEVIARGSSIEYQHPTSGPDRDRPGAGRRLPADRHGAVGERGGPIGSGSRPSWSKRAQARRPAPAGCSSSTPRSPTSSRCRPTSRPRWPTRWASPWATARGAS